MSITASEARRRLFPLIESVNDNAEAVEIVSRAGSAYLVPAAEYEAWRTTAHLFAAPANARRLLESYREATAGSAVPRDLVDAEDAEPDDATTTATKTEAAGAATDEPLLAGLDITDKGHSAQHAGFIARLTDAAHARGIALEGAREVVFLIVPVDPTEFPATQIEDLRFAPEGEGESGARDR